MRGDGHVIRGAIVSVGAVVLAIVALNTSLPGQTRVFGESPAFQAGIGAHEAGTESQVAPDSSNANAISAPAEIEIPAPTRTSFMATWPGDEQAEGYLLDVSTSPSFSNYLEGYHDLDVGKVSGRVVTDLHPGTTYYYRVRAYAASTPGSYSEAMTATTVATTGLVIHAAFDSSIVNNPNAAAIEAMINRAISIYESLFSDPITLQIRFRYSTTAPNGNPLPAGTISRSDWVYYAIPWNAYISSLRADATTSNDSVANGSLPASPLTTYITASSANGRAVALNTPTAMFANGSVGQGGPYDGIVTLNSAKPFQFTRPVNASNFDAQRSTQHEIDEVIGLGSHLNISGTYSGDLRPQDLFSWSSSNVRNYNSTGTRYFSINHGSTNIVNFNQNQTGDFGDWLSASCPQAHPYVQNAFNCTGQSSDVAATSPEGINLDVIGYDLANLPTPTPTPTPTPVARAVVADFNADGHPDYVLRNASTRQTAIWYLNNNVYVSSDYGPTLPTGWSLKDGADFNSDTHPDYALFNLTTKQTGILYLSGPTVIGGAFGPTLPSGWELVGAADFNADGNPDYVLYNTSTHQTAVWYLNNNVLVGGDVGPSLPSGWTIVGIADFDGDGHPDYLLFYPGSGSTAIAYLSGTTLVGAALGPTIPGNWAVVATADFNGDGKPDYLLYNAVTRQTAIWYLNNNVFVSGLAGPTLPTGWSLIRP